MKSKIVVVKGGSQTSLKQHNINLVMRSIYQDAPITKKEIMLKTGLSFAKVNSITMDLLSIGLITETGKAESNGGRRSAIYQINPDYGFVIGCELSHKKVTTIIVDLKAKIISQHATAFDIKLGKESLIAKFLDSIRTELDILVNSKKKVIGIGIAVAGLVNPQTGMSTPFPHLVDWGDLALKETLRRNSGTIVISKTSPMQLRSPNNNTVKRTALIISWPSMLAAGWEWALFWTDVCIKELPEARANWAYNR
jgi:hypothetical protein